MGELTPKEQEQAKREAWLEDRKNVITSTDVAILFGEGYSGTSPSLLYAQKKGLAPDVFASEKMEWGLLLEDDIAEMYYRKTGIPIRLTDPYSLSRSKSNPRFAATLDGYDAEGTLIEMKNTEEWVKEQDEDTLFMGWRVQAQWQMLCTGEKRCRIVACVRGCRLVIVDQELDEDFIQIAQDKALKFLGHLDSNEPPAPTGPDDDDAMKYLWSAEPGTVAEIHDPAILEILDRRDAAKAELKEKEKEEKTAAAVLKDFMRGNEVAILPDGSKLTWKADKNGRRSFRRSQPKRGS